MTPVSVLERRDDRIEGFEYLRAVMSLFVVAWHMKIAGATLTHSRADYIGQALTVSEFVNFHLLLLAVPTFIFVSAYLYALTDVDGASLRKRIRRIGILLTFWPCAWIVYQSGIRGLRETIPHSIISLVVTLLQAGDTIYYFFVSLLACLLAVHAAARCSFRVQMLGFAVATLLLSVLPQIGSFSGVAELSAYWNPLNFIPLSLGAVLVAQNREWIHRHKTIILAVLAVATSVFAKLEWSYAIGDTYFPDGGVAIPPYTRASLVFAVLAVGIIALEAKLKANGLVRFMAKYSLALYCLHLFVMEPMKRLVSKVSQDHMIVTSVSFVLVIVASYAVAMFLRIYLKEEVIM
jgi:peptidoglycan/LPS O-acetylase OafA/YrhL